MPLHRTLLSCAVAVVLALSNPRAGWPQAAAKDPPEPTITLTFEQTRLDSAIDRIAEAAGVAVVYTDRVVPVERVVSDTLVAVPLRAALARILRNTGVVVGESEGGGLVLMKGGSSSRGHGRDTLNVIGGLIRASDTTVVLVGAVVEVKGTGRTATTKTDGAYLLYAVPPGRQTLVARMIGYRPVEQIVTVPDSGSLRVDFILAMQPLRLQELVTTATGPQRRLDLGNQVTVLRADSIVRSQPIKDLTDLLETRVPGLATLPSTGAPGDPTRLRLRGSSSILGSNDPIVIVDGVRVYAEQSATRSASLAWAFDNAGVPAPSSLDRIDPNSIETIEVLNGPSAATLYGADAANGVIVVTTRQGRAGPARWDVSLTHGRSIIPGRFPDAYFTFGHSLNDDLANCAVTEPDRAPTCVVDSVVTYQVLNDPELTPLGEGSRSGMSATVSGGNTDVRYAVTGTFSDEAGLLQLPDYEASRYRATFGRPVEDWMAQPHRMREWSVTSRFDFRPARPVNVALTMGLAGDEQRRSTLEQQLSTLRGAYVDKATGAVYLNGPDDPPGASLVPDFYRRTTNRGLGIKTGVNLDWLAFERLTLRADAGLSADLRRDESLLPAGLLFLGTHGSADSLGFLATGQGAVTVGTLNLGARYEVPLGSGFALDAAVGFNYNSRSVSDLTRRVVDPNAGDAATGVSNQFNDHLTSYGWYVEPRLAHKRFSLSTGLRLDAGSNYGDRSGGFALPKISASWVVSDEPFFPIRNSGFLSLLRLRAAYGEAGIQPGAVDRLRLYSRSTRELEGQPARVLELDRLGNTRLRPERSSEIEGGVDADLFDGRLFFSLTGYRKTKNDALLDVPVPFSVNGGGRVLVNIGEVRNSGYELTLGTHLLRGDGVSWSTQLQFSRNRNVVLSLADGVESFGIGGGETSRGGQRIVAGYPLFGYWERPIVGYHDQNADGMLQGTEVLLGDSLAFLGAPEPNYVTGLHTTLGFFGGGLTVQAGFDYRDGLAQRNEAPGGALARAAADPSAPLADQALVVPAAGDQFGTSYGLIQTVSTFRFNSLAVEWRLPRRFSHWVGAERASLAVQGTNLGLVTSYRGKDPLVNSVATGNRVIDAGALPQPREWYVRLNFSY